MANSGQQIQLQDVDWEELEAIVAELGERRRSRIACHDRTLEIRMPLPEYELYYRECFKDVGQAMVGCDDRPTA